MIYRWEDDRGGISERYRLHYCRAFQIPAGWFGKPAALDVPPVSGTGQPGVRRTFGQHSGMVTRPTQASPASDPAGLADRLPSVRDRMHAAVDQLCDGQDRDQFCFLLGYLCALLALPRASGESSGPVPAEPGTGDSRDG